MHYVLNFHDQEEPAKVVNAETEDLLQQHVAIFAEDNLPKDKHSTVLATPLDTDTRQEFEVSNITTVRKRK